MTEIPSLFDEPVITVSQDLIRKVGLEEAIALQMIRDWLSSAAHQENQVSKGLVSCTIDAWQHRLFSFWSVEELQHIFNKLEKRKFLKKALPCIPEREARYSLTLELLESLDTAGESR